MKKSAEYSLIILLFVVVFGGYSCGFQKPSWLQGYSNQYPEQRYFSGVGLGRTTAEAEEMARAEITRVFLLQMHDIPDPRVNFWLKKSGGKGTDVAEFLGYTTKSVKLKGTIQDGAKVVGRYRDSEMDRHYALAVLDRNEMARELRLVLGDIDNELKRNIDQAKIESNPVYKLSHYLRALNAMDQRRKVEDELGIIDSTAIIPISQYSLEDIAFWVEETAQTIKIGLYIENDPDGQVEKAVSEELSSLGMSVTSHYAADLMVEGGVSVDEYEYEEPWHWTRAAAQIELSANDGRLHDPLNTTVREGSRDKRRSRKVARESLGKKIAEELIAEIVEFSAITQK